MEARYGALLRVMFRYTVCNCYVTVLQVFLFLRSNNSTNIIIVVVATMDVSWQRRQTLVVLFSGIVVIIIESSFYSVQAPEES